MAKRKRPGDKSEFRALRLTPAEVDKVRRLAPMAGDAGNFSGTIRWLIAVAPEPGELAQRAMSEKVSE